MQNLYTTPSSAIALIGQDENAKHDHVENSSAGLGIDGAHNHGAREYTTEILLDSEHWI